MYFDWNRNIDNGFVILHRTETFSLAERLKAHDYLIFDVDDKGELSYEEAVQEYENRKNTRLGTLVANRELPILYRAKEIIDDIESE